MTHAAQRGVEFRDLRIEVEGDYDLRGYLALDQQTRPGFGSLRYTIHVDTDATESTLEEIREAVEAGSPVVDNVLNASPLAGAVVRQPLRTVRRSVEGGEAGGAGGHAPPGPRSP